MDWGERTYSSDGFGVGQKYSGRCSAGRRHLVVKEEEDPRGMSIFLLAPYLKFGSADQIGRLDKSRSIESSNHGYARS